MKEDMNDPWVDLCTAGSGMILWGCSLIAWARPVVSAIALLLSVTATGVALYRSIHALIRERRRDRASRIALECD